jgi:hypothetical protein
MRTESFETPWFIREDQTTTVDNDIRKMINLAKDKPETSDIVNNFLQKVIAKGKQLLGMSTTEATQTATLQMNGQLAMQILQKICQQFPPEQCKQFMSAVGKGAEQTAGIIATNIASRFRQQGIAEYKQLDTFIAKMLERIPNANTPAEVAKIRTMFEKDNIKPEDAKIFLQAAAEGKVIDLLKMIEAREGNIDTFVNPLIKNTYKQVILDFFNILPTSTGGNVGPGEYALILLGSPAEKVAKGDLLIGKDKYEIKASSIKRAPMTKLGQPGKGGASGAVLGGDKIPIGKSVWPAVNKILKKYGIESTEIEDPKKPGQMKARYNLNLPGLERLNQSRGWNKLNISNKANLLSDIIYAIYPSLLIKKEEITKKIQLILKDYDGNIGAESYDNNFFKLLTKITLNVYKQDPNKDNFIFFNKTSRNFKVLKGEEFNQELDSNSSNLKIISGIDFNDGSYKASPRLYLK